MSSGLILLREWGRKAVSIPLKSSVSQGGLMLLSDVVVIIIRTIMCLGIVFACMEVHALCLWRPEEGVRFPGTGLQMVLSHQVGMLGNPTQDLWQSGQCS